jgi:hypothetical protein
MNFSTTTTTTASVMRLLTLLSSSIRPTSAVGVAVGVRRPVSVSVRLVVPSSASVRAAAAAAGRVRRRRGHVVGVFALIASRTPTHLEVATGFLVLRGAATSDVSSSTSASASGVLKHVSSAVD